MYQVRVTTRDEYDDMPHCEKVISGYGRQARECRAMADFCVEYQLPGAPDGVANWICRDHVGVRLAELALKLPLHDISMAVARVQKTEFNNYITIKDEFFAR